MSRAAEEEGSVTPSGERPGELTDAIAAELIGGIDRELGVAVADDLTLFTERAGDDVDLGAVGDVMSDGGAVARLSSSGWAWTKSRRGAWGEDIEPNIPPPSTLAEHPAGAYKLGPVAGLPARGREGAASDLS